MCDTREVGENHSLPIQSGEDIRAISESTHYTLLKMSGMNLTVFNKLYISLHGSIEENVFSQMLLSGRT